MVGFSITAPKRKRALLLHYGGEQLQNVFDTLPDTGTDNDHERACDALKAHFVPKKNIIYETILFRRLTQEADENVAQFCTRLQKEAEKCQFTEVECELVTQIITGCWSGQLRRRALEKQTFLDTLIELARSLELSHERADGVEADKVTQFHRVSSQHLRRSVRDAWRRISSVEECCSHVWVHIMWTHHVNSSPHFPQSNGKAEKTKKDGTDPYLAFLDYQNTPIDGLDASPAQMLMQRRTSNTLPTASKLLEPKVLPNIHQKLKLKQQTQKKYFDS